MPHIFLRLLRFVWYRFPMTILTYLRLPIYKLASRTQETEPLADASQDDQESQQCSQCEDAKAEMETLTVEIDSLKEALEGKDRELDKWQAKERIARHDSHRFRAERDDAHKRADKHHDEYVTLSNFTQGLQARFSQLEARANQLQTNVAELERALSVAQNERRKTAGLLEIKGAELREAQLYLNKMDDVPDREVQAIVEKLNSTIFQTAATVADSFQERYQCQAGVALAEEACARLERSQLINPELAQAILSADNSADSVLVQTAIQTVVVSYSRWLCTTWDFRVSDAPSLLQAVYAQMREHGTYYFSPAYPLRLTGLTRASLRRW